MGTYRTFWTTPEHAQVMKPNLSWSYRIQGVAEAPADPTLHTFGVPLATGTSCYIHLFGQRVRNISEETHRNTEVCTFCVHSDILCIILNILCNHYCTSHISSCQQLVARFVPDVASLGELGIM